MKKLLILFLIINSSFEAFSQKGQCNCLEAELTSENQHKCDTTYFQNGSKLYWQWNCDSTWLTFENTEKLILKTCEEMNVYSCQRTGLGFLKEYSSYLLFQHKWISGCCTPPDLIFLSKDNCTEIRRIKKRQFVHGAIEDDYVLFFSDTTLTELIYLDHLTNNKFRISFEPEQILHSLTKNGSIELTQLFRNYKIEKEAVTFDFKSNKGVWLSMKIEMKTI